MKPRYLMNIMRKTDIELGKWIARIAPASVHTEDYLYIPGNHPVLWVAHLDTVYHKPPKRILTDGEYIWSPSGIGGDDRCGVAMLMQSLNLKVRPHMLFTYKEETGCIGARGFCNDKAIKIDVNFIVEVDRRGYKEAVFYSCGNQKFIDKVCRGDLVEKTGSMSDISYIAPHLDRAAVNISAGYHEEHGYSAEYVVMSQVNEMYKELLDLTFDKSLYGKTWKYEKKTYATFSGYSGYARGGRWNSWEDDDRYWGELADHRAEPYTPTKNAMSTKATPVVREVPPPPPEPKKYCSLDKFVNMNTGELTTAVWELSQWGKVVLTGSIQMIQAHLRTEGDTYGQKYGLSVGVKGSDDVLGLY